MRRLTVNKAITRKLVAGDYHQYQLHLPTESFVVVKVQQRGIDVAVRLCDIKGNQIGEPYDTPNGVKEVEEVYWVTDEKGNYEVDVRALGQQSESGSYSIRFVGQKSAIASERQKFEDIQKVLRLSKQYSKLVNERKFEEAIPLIEQVIELREKRLKQGLTEILSTYNELGAAYYFRGEYKGAAVVWQKGVDLATPHQRGREDVTTIRGQIALAQMELGKYALAEREYKNILAIQRRVSGPESEQVASTLNNLGGLYHTLGNYPLAAKHFKDALKIVQPAPDIQTTDVAQFQNNLGLTHYESGDYAQAEPLFKSALAIRRKLKDYPGIGETLHNLGSNAAALKKYPEAEQMLREALSIRRNGEDPGAVAWSAQNLGYLYQELKRFSEAEPLLREAVDIRRVGLGELHPYYLYSRAGVGEYLYDRGRYREARELLAGALETQEKVVGLYHPDVSRSLNALAKVAEAEGNYSEAAGLRERLEKAQEFNLKLNLSSGSEQQKFRYLLHFSRDTDHAVSLHLNNDTKNSRAARLALTNVLHRKGRTLDVMASTFSSLRVRLKPETRRVFGHLVDSQSQLALLFLRGPGYDFQQYSAEIARLEAMISDAESQLSNLSSELRAETESATIESVQRNIPEDAALVEIVLYQPFKATATDVPAFGNEKYAAYILRRNGEIRWADLGPAEDIDREVFAFRAALRNPKNEVLTLARALYQKLMSPIQDALGGSTSILISPDGALNLIPFSALADERKEYLVKTYTFIYLTSGRDLLRSKSQFAGQQPPVIVANPLFGQANHRLEAGPLNATNVIQRRSRSFGEHFGPLHGTQQEGLALKPLLRNATLLTGSNATEGAVKRLHGPEVLHIATHGFFLADEASSESETIASSQFSRSLKRENRLLRSGLALAGANRRYGGPKEDGILTALEASALDLWGTKLVVLSACETGVGQVQNGEGVYGMRRALVLSGTESQVMSLWKVDDEATKNLMVNYYRLLKAGSGRAVALRDVQRKALDSDDKHPYFWAAFIASGEWRSLSGR